jgi:hypothetical protein
MTQEAVLELPGDLAGEHSLEECSDCYSALAEGLDGRKLAASKHLPLANQPSEGGESLKSFQRRMSAGSASRWSHRRLGTSRVGTPFIPTWILRPRLGRILQETPQRRLYRRHRARRDGRTLDRGTRIRGVLTIPNLEHGMKECPAFLSPKAAVRRGWCRRGPPV